MTISRILAVGVVGLSVGLAASVWGQDGPPGPPPGGPGTRPMRGPGGPGRGGMPMGLGQAMRDMGQMYKALKANATDPEKRDEALKGVETMERDAAIAKLNLPPSAQRAPADNKAKMVEDYRTQMSDLMKTLLSLEDAIAAKNTDDVNKGLDAIKAAMDKGHGEFIPKKEE